MTLSVSLYLYCTANNTKLFIFAAKDKANTYSEHLKHNDNYFFI